jgi:dTMP kinase
MFVAIEGIDGSGKTTQANMLAAWLTKNGHVAFVVSNPGTTEVGTAVRSIVKDATVPMSPHTQSLLFAAARCDLADFIREKIRDGRIVICDRWSMSTMAYQGLDGGVPHSMLDSLNGFVGLQPDITFLIDVNVDTAVKRLTRRASDSENDRYEKREILTKVRAAYEREFDEAVKQRHGLYGQLQGICGDHSPEQVSAVICSLVAGKFAELKAAKKTA